MKKNKFKYIPFHIKITVFTVIFVLVMLAAVSVIFYYTSGKIKESAISKLEFSANSVTSSIDEIVLNVYNVSDTFAIDGRLDDYINKDYENDIIKKRVNTLKIINNLFASYDLLRTNEKMAAYYTNDKILYNFLDPNANEDICKKQLEILDVNDKDKLGKFCWYGVQKNFLKTDMTGELRKDMAVIGSRRVFSQLYNSYEGVHIFAIDEETFYNKYKDLANQYTADIYIVDENGVLLSSSNENALKEGVISKELIDKVINERYNRISLDDGDQFVIASRSNVNGWVTIVCASMADITADMDNLLKGIIWIIVGCSIFALFAIVILYWRFISPIKQLNESMQKVYKGDLTAYVKPGKNNELSEMINYYNSMLNGINKNIQQRLQMEKHKKKLEMEVLMNQINPHFLYNTLETIVWKSSEAGRPDIGRIAASLGRMYRLSVSRGDLFISLKNELEHVMSYIKIQESRYEGKFEFKAVTMESEAINKYYTLKMILQPIVENSINHGMVDIDRILQIKIQVKVLSDYIKIRIIDNGIGMTSEKLDEVRNKIKYGTVNDQASQNKSTGIGMHNVNERLKIYFGVENAINIYSKWNVGTIVDIRIPKILKDEAEKRNKNKN